MMRFDCHTHILPYSTDGHMTYEEMAKRRDELGIGGVLTDHIDLDSKEGFTFDPAVFFREMGSFRSERQLLGVEFGMTRETMAEATKIAGSHPFDMVIGSIHFIEGVDIYEKNFFAGFSGKADCMRRYLDAMIEMAESFGDFDTLGHMDYIGRVAPYEDPLLHYGEYPEKCDRVLKALVKRDISLEINTRQFHLPAGVKALEEILCRYKDLGGVHVTIGSDAHRTPVLGAYLTEGYSLAKKVGLMPVVYKERKRINLGDC